MPERSFFFRGYQFPVCARCTGMILGYIISLITLLFHLSIPTLLASIIMIPMIIDGIIQLKTTYVSNNFKRAVTGILFGFGFLEIICNTAIWFIGLFGGA